MQICLTDSGKTERMVSEKPLRLVKKGYRGDNDSGDFYVKLNITNEIDIPEEKLNQIRELVK